MKTINKITRKKTLFILLTIFTLNSLFSCKTTDIITHTITKEEKEILEASKIEIINYRILNSKTSLENATTNLKNAKKSFSKNKKYLASLTGLYEYTKYLNKKNLIKQKTIKKIEKLNKKEETLFILKSLTQNDKKAIETLEEGLKTCPSSLLIRDRLQEIYYKQKKFSKAMILQNYLAINSYNEKQFRAYKKLANFNKRLAKSQDENINTNLISKNSMSVKKCIELITKESNLMPLAKKSSTNKIFKNLKESGAIYNTALSLNSPIKRKDVAYLLVSLIAKLEDDNLILIEAKNYYNRNYNGKSPIKDIKVDDYYFSSVIYLIENNYIQSLEGNKFYPEKDIKPENFIYLLKNINKVFY